MTKSKIRVLILSFVTLLCCLTLVTAATFALFSKDVKVSSHLQAGNLNVKLERMSYRWTHLNDNGFEDTVSKQEVIDLTDEKNANANVFGLEEDALTAPGCEYTANLKLTNNGNVAFMYWIEIVLDTQSDAVFAGQLEVTIAVEGGKTYEGVRLNTDNLNYGKDGGLAVVGVKDHNVSEFTISVRFVSSDNNNAAMDKDVMFDLVVHAEQVTAAPESWN